ncbi:hypothetical protein SH528x_002933 [Novipirellula sp. SH528]
MTDSERYNRINVHHHLREDVVVLLPYVPYRHRPLPLQPEMWADRNSLAS